MAVPQGKKDSKAYSRKGGAVMTQAPMDACFICDAGYVVPTAAAIESLVEKGHGERALRIFVVTADLPAETERLFSDFAGPGVSISVVRASSKELSSLHVPEEGSSCVATPAALLKFSLGELLPGLDRVLYMDGDVIVRSDLGEIFDLDLCGNVLAAAPDTGSLYCRRPVHDEVAGYFNSGVMVIDLAKMRSEGLAEKLIAAKRESPDGMLMDQDVFNRVLDGRTVRMPPRFNCLATNLLRAFSAGLIDIEAFNAAFGTSYSDFGAFLGDAAVLHFASREKPWKFSDVPFASMWAAAYARSPASVRLPLPEREIFNAPWTVDSARIADLDSVWRGEDRGSRIRSIGLVYHALGKGGIERTASFQLPMFCRMGLKVTAFVNTKSDGSDYIEAQDFDRVDLSDFSDDPKKRALALRRELCARKIDLLIHHDAYESESLSLDIRAARTSGARAAVFWNNVFTHFYLRPDRQFDADEMFGSCRGASAMLTLTRIDAAFFALGGFNAFAMPFSDPDLCADFVRTSHPRRLLWLGRIVEQKRPVDALEILLRVRRKFPDAELVLLGDGDGMTERCVNDWLSSHPECARFVRREGFRKDVRPYLESCGVGLVTSRFEGFCHSVVEMKMASMPVVAYRMPYLDTLQPGSGAVCVPQCDVDAAAEAVCRLFGDDDEFRRQSESARRSYEELSSQSEEERYRNLFAWFEAGCPSTSAPDGRAMRGVVDTLIEHMQTALGVRVRAVKEEWSRDRSYRLGRMVSWPWRKLKRFVTRARDVMKGGNCKV